MRNGSRAVMNDLHAALHAAVMQRLVVARAASVAWRDVGVVTDGGTLGVPFVADDAVVNYITANDPDAAIRACEADLERLAEHPDCHDPDDGCEELPRIARVHGVNILTEAE